MIGNFKFLGTKLDSKPLATLIVAEQTGRCRATRTGFLAIGLNCVSNNSTSFLNLNATVKLIRFQFSLMESVEPRDEKTGFLHMRKQRRRSASR